MKTLSVRQPYADLIAYGLKRIELRSWTTSYRGDLLIAASQRPCSKHDLHELRYVLDLDCYEPRYGVAICIVTLADVRPATPADAKPALCHDPVGYAWVLTKPRLITSPIPIVGRLGLYDSALPALVATSIPKSWQSAIPST